MNEKIYLHTINNGFKDYYDPKKQKVILESILRDKEILSKRKQGFNERNTPLNFCGLDYISLSDYEKRFVSNKEKAYYNCYYAYSRAGLSLTFPQEKIKVIEPTILPVCNRNFRDFDLMKYYGMCISERYTDLPDEVQVKDSISLEHVNGLLFPTDNFMKSKIFARKEKMIILLKKELEILNKMLKDYNYDISIYDVDTLLELNDDNINKLTLK